MGLSDMLSRNKCDFLAVLFDAEIEAFTREMKKKIVLTDYVLYASTKT
jgi:hypothetical protein